jgi:hypothetical protein
MSNVSPAQRQASAEHTWQTGGLEKKLLSNLHCSLMALLKKGMRHFMCLC